MKINQKKQQSSVIKRSDELVRTSIGLTGSRATVNFHIDESDSSFRCYKTRQQTLEALNIPYHKRIRTAFNLIIKRSQYFKLKSNTVFLPTALHNGDYGTLSKFLNNLKKNRVESYIKLKIQDSTGYFGKTTSLIRKLSTILQLKKKTSFLKLSTNYFLSKQLCENKPIQDQFGNISSIDDQGTQYDYDTPKSDNRKFINVKYSLMRMNPQKQSDKSIETTRPENKRKTEVVVSELMKKSKQTVYRFERVSGFGKHSFREV